eukprot:1161828-Pelagomonas_calceolata.AAC.6
MPLLLATPANPAPAAAAARGYVGADAVGVVGRVGAHSGWAAAQVGEGAADGGAMRGCTAAAAVAVDVVVAAAGGGAEGAGAEGGEPSELAGALQPEPCRLHVCAGTAAGIAAGAAKAGAEDAVEVGEGSDVVAGGVVQRGQLGQEREQLLSGSGLHAYRVAAEAEFLQSREMHQHPERLHAAYQVVLQVELAQGMGVRRWGSV